MIFVAPFRVSCILIIVAAIRGEIIQNRGSGERKTSHAVAGQNTGVESLPVFDLEKTCAIHVWLLASLFRSRYFGFPVIFCFGQIAAFQVNLELLQIA